MGARAGGGGGFGGRQATFAKAMSGFQAQYKKALKTYNKIKKGLPKGGPVSQSYAANKIMKAKGMKTPSEIKVEMSNYSHNFSWGSTF